MTSVRLNDPERTPRHWSALIAAGQFAVSHFDDKTGTWRTASGEYSNSPEEEVILLFDTFAEAEAYCRKHVEQLPSTFCRIYDHRGSAEGRVAQIYSRELTERDHSPRAARRKLWNGIAQLTFGILCVVVDWWWGGPVILGVVVGSKFLTSGIVRLVQGIAGLMDRTA